MKKFIVLVLSVISLNSWAQETPAFEYIWNEGDGTVTIPATDIDLFGQVTGRVEVDWTPRLLHTDNTSQRILDIPNHLGIWVYNDGIHGQWFNDASANRLWRARWGLPQAGVETKIVVTWNADGYAVLVDGVLRIHDWQTAPTVIYPDPDITTGVYGSTTSGSNPVTGNFNLRVYDASASYDPCSVDIVGTINEGLPLDNTGSWSQGIDPDCTVGTTYPITLTWTNATQNVDGTNIDLTGPGALATTTVFWSVCDPNDEVIITPGLDKTVPTTVPGNVETTTVDVGFPARWCFIAQHANEAGNTSDFSPTSVKIITVVPEPPTNLRVGPDNLYVYFVSQSEEVIVLIPAGTVPVDTPCDGGMSVNGYYRVPKSNVSWIGNVNPPVVFALCQ